MWIRHPVYEDDEGQLRCPVCRHRMLGDVYASVEKGHMVSWRRYRWDRPAPWRKI